MKTSGGQSPEWTNRKYKREGLWAYQPVKKPAPLKSAGHPIDAFIAAKMPPGLQPANVPLHTRALADVCLALLNSNEFAYVY